MTNKDVDGYAHINTADDGLVLTVYPAQGSGKRVGLESVRSDIEKAGVKGVNWEDVKHVVDNSAGHAVVLVQSKPKNGDSQIFVEVSDDEMSAKVTVVGPEGGKPATLDRVRSALAAQGVVYGLREDLLNALAGPLAAQTAQSAPIETLAAEGQPVIHGHDAYIEKFWEKGKKDEAAVAADKNAKVDYRNLNVIDNVAKDSVLCRLVPVKQGRPGKTVTGKTIEPTIGLDMTLAPGQGVAKDPADPTQYIAVETGQVVFKQTETEEETPAGKILVRSATIAVLAIYEVNGDLTLKIGNIDFFGTVLIHGSVTGEYKVKAGQDVVIDGVLDGGEVTAGGKVQIRGGIIGQKTRVTANGNVEAKYVRNAYVDSGGAVTIVDGVMHSTVIASDKVVLSGRGMLVGGTTVAGWEVTCKEIGAKSNVPTEIEVGEDPRMREEIKRIDKEAKGIAEQIDKTKKGIQFLKDLTAKLGGKLPDDKKDMLNKLTRAQFKLLADYKALSAAKAEIDAKAAAEKGKRRAKVSCSGPIYPGTKITVSRVSKVVSLDEKFTSYVEDNGQIKTLPFH